MNTPSAADWDQLVMGLLDADEAERLLELARTDPDWEAAYLAAKRAHVERIRAYEAYDQRHDELRDELMATLPAGPPRRVQDGVVLRVWRRTGELAMSLNNKVTRRAAAVMFPAAAVLVAAVLFLMPGKSMALAAVIERLRDAKTIQCRIETFMNGAPEPMQTGEMYLSDEFGTFADLRVIGHISQKLWRAPDGPGIMWLPKLETAVRIEGMEHAEASGSSSSASSPDEFVRKLLELTDDADRELPPRVIDGQKTIGYEIAGSKLGLYSPGPREVEAGESAPQVRVWVSLATGLPARMEVDMTVYGAGLGDMHMLVVQDQFVYDQSLDKTLFEPAIPDDAKWVEMTIPPPTEATLIAGLRQYADATRQFPLTLDPARVSAEFTVALMTSGKLAVDPENPLAATLTEPLMEVAQACAFYGSLVGDGRMPEYFGDAVTPEDVDDVLIQWRTPDGDLRVIYGDLRAETLKR